MPDATERIGTGSSELNRAEELRQAQARLLNRPLISIRLRFIASLAVGFFMCCAFALDSLMLLGSLREGIVVLGTLSEISDRLRAAQVSKEDLLSGRQDLREAGINLYAAEEALNTGGPVRSPEVSSASLSDLSGAIARQRARMVEWEALRAREVAGAEGNAALAAALDGAGSDLSLRVEAMARSVRAGLVHKLSLSKNVPFIMLGVILALFAVVAYLHARALQDPIRRFQAYAGRIAQSDFTLIRPSRSYRDEFTDLALALNQMLADLRATQQRCVEAGKLAAIGTITSGIAHEINNPLNNISLTTEALMEDFKTMSDEKKWNFLQDIYFETERASEIVKSLLDFTRTQTIERVPLDVGGVILSTQRLLQNEMVLNNVAFECDLPPDLPQVKGAANQLRQVFLNLFINAIHAMPGGGTLRVTANLHEEDRVCVEVRDGGVGISPEVLPHVFDPFFTTKEPGKGTGLGLSVSLSIIKRHGGDIQVESVPGKGTTFHICLPRADGT